MDEKVAKSQFTVKDAIVQYKNEANLGRIERMGKNRDNRATLNSESSFHHKISGQSREFLPKLSTAVRQFASFINQGLVQSGDWFSMDLKDEEHLKDYECVQIMRSFIENLDVNENKSRNFATLISDAVKAGCTDSLMIFKVHGRATNSEAYQIKPKSDILSYDGTPLEQEDSVVRANQRTWKLRIDLVKDVDYYPDPTGRGLYEIQTMERDIHDVIKSAEAGLYDMAEVKKLVNQMTEASAPLDTKREEEEPNVQSPQFRHKVQIIEFWGTILDDKGRIVHENIVAAVANESFLIRKPEPNPFWHNESPFVTAPLIRVPYSVWHKALYDEASELNLSINELYNLIFDGALASVWGVKQVRKDWMENPEDVSGGIAAQQTIVANSQTPVGGKVVETVAVGQVPPEALAVFNSLDKEFQAAALTNDLKLGNLPSKRVKAAEVYESQSGQTATVEVVVGNIENELIEPLLKKVWLTILQFSDQLPETSYTQSLTVDTIFKFTTMKQADKFMRFATGTRFKVSGLSSTLNKQKDFQKLVTLIQVAGSNPVMLQAFFKKYNPGKILDTMVRILNLNPESFNVDQNEEAQAEQAQNASELPFFSQISNQSNSNAGNSNE